MHNDATEYATRLVILRVFDGFSLGETRVDFSVSLTSRSSCIFFFFFLSLKRIHMRILFYIFTYLPSRQFAYQKIKRTLHDVLYCEILFLRFLNKNTDPSIVREYRENCSVTFLLYFSTFDTRAIFAKDEALPKRRCTEIGILLSPLFYRLNFEQARSLFIQI